MIGKKLLTLLSLAMGIAIVAWAVTDNADPFGVKVSPGTVGPDTTKFVTLSYGDSTFANVDNLKAGEPRIAGSILLKADTKDGSTFDHACCGNGWLVVRTHFPSSHQSSSLPRCPLCIRRSLGCK